MRARRLWHSTDMCLVRSPSPVLVGDYAPLHFLMVLSDANGQPGAKLAIVEGVHHAENLALVKAQPVRRFFLVLKVRPDVEGITDV